MAKLKNSQFSTGVSLRILPFPIIPSTNILWDSQAIWPQWQSPSQSNSLLISHLWLRHASPHPRLLFSPNKTFQNPLIIPLSWFSNSWSLANGHLLIVTVHLKMWCPDQNIMLWVFIITFGQVNINVVKILYFFLFKPRSFQWNSLLSSERKSLRCEKTILARENEIVLITEWTARKTLMETRELEEHY